VAGFAAGLLVALSPLLVRNALVGAPLLAFDTRPLVGIPWANARGADGSVSTSPLLMDVLRKARGSTLRAAVWTLETWRDDPLGLPALVVRKLASAVNGAEIPDNASFGFFRDRLPWLSRLPLFACVFGPGVAGLLLAKRSGLLRKGEGFLLAGAGLVPLAACVLVSTTTRYRGGAAAPLALGTALLGALAFEAIRARDVRSLLPYLATAAILSAQTLLPSLVRARPNRWSDTIVAATLAESKISPEAGAAEIQRYLEGEAGDPDRERGVLVMQYWLAGERAFARVEPEGIAPPERRYRKPQR
jgi:hypothetical protein